MRARELRRASPDAERAIWQRLRDRGLDGYNFRRQHPVGRYFSDLACVEARLIVELDGGQHYEPAAMAADAQRSGVLTANGFHVMRFSNREALAERDGVLTAILDWLRLHHPHPSPLPLAEEGAEQCPLPQAGEGATPARTET